MGIRAVIVGALALRSHAGWATTKAYGATGYSYTAAPASGVKAKAIASAGARTMLAR